jgi:hypothetical protein
MLELEAICRRYTVVAARPEHAVAMAPLLRPGDRNEIWAAAAVDPLRGLEISLDASRYAWTWLVDGLPACMFGVGCAPVPDGIGIPWLLSAISVDRHWLPFLRYYRPFLDRMRADFPLLTNWVDARYAAALRWIGWMGFRIFPAEPYGPFALLHHRFELRADTAA